MKSFCRNIQHRSVHDEPSQGKEHNAESQDNKSMNNYTVGKYASYLFDVPGSMIIGKIALCCYNKRIGQVSKNAYHTRYERIDAIVINIERLKYQSG